MGLATAAEIATVVLYGSYRSVVCYLPLNGHSGFPKSQHSRSYGPVRAIVLTHSHFGLQNIFLFIPSSMTILTTHPSTCHSRASVRLPELDTGTTMAMPHAQLSWWPLTQGGYGLGTGTNYFSTLLREEVGGGGVKLLC